jgi:2-amino-4-hydroxy-6-hydroxymethyldihydropteridine diphosphokinase
MHTVYLGLGSNLGNKEQHIREAVRKIQALVGAVVRQSTLYVTEPWGFQSENLFVNAVVCCETEHTPREVLQLTQQIERAMGRRRKSVNRQYHDRVIDIDILLYDDLIVDEPDLKIPHPLMHEREFVMKPLEEIQK